MFDPATLAGAVIGVLVASFGKAAKKVTEDVASHVGEKITTWVKTKLSGAAAEEAISDLEAKPEDQAAQLTLHGQLLKRLQEDQGLCEELAELLKEAEQAGYTVDQDLSISGAGNVGVQIAGDRNVVKTGGSD